MYCGMLLLYNICMIAYVYTSCQVTYGVLKRLCFPLSLNPFLPDCKATFSWIFLHFSMLFLFLRP